jgi:negative regulator of sigma E activity
MGESSPLFTHTFPWASMGISLGTAAILFLAALKVVQTREY